MPVLASPLLLLFTLTLHLLKVLPVKASAGLFTYYEDPFLPSPDSPNLILELGPSRWRHMNIPNNECGGNGQINGFGQSPIVIPPEVESTCHADLAGYEFEQGNCTWDQLFFQILPNGVWVGPVRILYIICWMLIYGGLYPSNYTALYPSSSL